MNDLFDRHVDHHVSIRVKISCDRCDDRQHVLIKHAENLPVMYERFPPLWVKTIDGGADVGGRRCLRNDAAFWLMTQAWAFISGDSL